MKWYKGFLLALFSVQAHALSVGQEAPDFTLLDQHEKAIHLADFRGQWVVLYFYPKADTPGCTTEACSFRDQINQLISKKAVIFGVSTDSPKEQLAFARKYDLPFSLLADDKGEVARAYDSLYNLGFVKFAKRNSFLINPQGEIAQAYWGVDPQRHVEEILKDLRRLSE
jgi:peroxiredoxin Q/BCP